MSDRKRLIEIAKKTGRLLAVEEDLTFSEYEALLAIMNETLPNQYNLLKDRGKLSLIFGSEEKESAAAATATL